MAETREDYAERIEKAPGKFNHLAQNLIIWPKSKASAWKIQLPLNYLIPQISRLRRAHPHSCLHRSVQMASERETPLNIYERSSDQCHGTYLVTVLFDDNPVNTLAGGGEVIGGPYRLLLLVIAEELELVCLDCFNRHNLVQQLHPLCDFTKGRIVTCVLYDDVTLCMMM